MTTGSGANAKLAIIDHEMCFYEELFWIPPWESSGFENYARYGQHIFGKPYNKTPQNLDGFMRSWQQLEMARIKGYFSGLPGSWYTENERLEKIFGLLAQSKTNIKQITQNALEVLS